MRKLAITFGALMMIVLSPLIGLGMVAHLIVGGFMFGWDAVRAMADWILEKIG